MQELLIFILKMSLCSALFFAYYKLFLKNRTFHSYNRFYLLSIVILSLILPFVKFNFYYSQISSPPSIIKVLSVTQDYSYFENFIAKTNTKSFDLWQLVPAIYFLISLIIFISFFKTFIEIYRLTKSNTEQRVPKFSLIFTDNEKSPFSFLNTIFWNENIDLKSEFGERILKHEIAHIEQKHSYDKIFLNLILVFFWINPVFWFIRNEINLIHEFLADKKAVEDGNTSQFAKMILITVYPKTNLSLINPFFYSPIKRRILMLNKKNRPIANYVSRILVLPLLFIGAMSFSARNGNNEKVQILNHQIIRVVLNAGHGGADFGASNQKLFEKDIVLKLVKKIVHLNKNKNIEFVLTRTNDIYQSPKDIANFTNNESPDLYISVHLNANNPNETKKKTGLEVAVAGNEFNNAFQSKILASAFIYVFENNYGLNVKENPVQKLGIWTLQEIKCPSILIEAGNISDKNDLDYLLSEKGQDDFGNNVLNAISLYASNELKEK